MMTMKRNLMFELKKSVIFCQVYDTVIWLHMYGSLYGGVVGGSLRGCREGKKMELLCILIEIQYWLQSSL